MAGLVPAIRHRIGATTDGREKPGHDGGDGNESLTLRAGTRAGMTPSIANICPDLRTG